MRRDYLIDNDLNTAPIVASASGSTTIIVASGRREIFIMGWDLLVTTAVTVQWKDDLGTALSGAYPFAANGGICVPRSKVPCIKVRPGGSLILVLGGSVAVAGSISFLQN